MTLGLDYERVSAFKGRIEWGRPSQCKAIIVIRHYVEREVPAGEIGYCVPHSMSWQALLDGGHKLAMALDDDLAFHDGFLLALDKVMAPRQQRDRSKLNRIRAIQLIMLHEPAECVMNANLGAITGMSARTLWVSWRMICSMPGRPYRVRSG